jgi:Helix-turn-helix domain/DnaJ domain
MKSFREQTYYELLEVRRGAPAEEVRAALRRALDAYAPDSVALYALVDEEQAEALRSRLQEAARVLVDPAARAGYDRMLGLEPEHLQVQTALWAEDDEAEETDAAQTLSAGPYRRTEPAQLERAGVSAPVNGAQASLGLETPPARWPARGAGANGFARPPGLPSPTPRTGMAAVAGGVGDNKGARPQGPPLPASPPAGAVGAVEERPRMPELPPDVEFNGELLRQVREARGLTLQQVAERTRIGRLHLERVEADRYADLPPSVYLRGILVSLARELKLDATRVSKSYLLLAARAARTEP